MNLGVVLLSQKHFHHYVLNKNPYKHGQLLGVTYANPIFLREALTINVVKHYNLPNFINFSAATKISASHTLEALEGEADVYPPANNSEPPADGVISATELYFYLRDT